MEKHFFISGMFRSGTTYLARALNTHKDLIVLSDPHRAFFKYVRNMFFSKEVKDFDIDSPLADYFLDQTELRKKFHAVFFDISLNDSDLKILKDQLVKGAELFSPFIKENIHCLKKGTVREVYDQLISLGGEIYGYTGHGLIGTKEVWTDEFISNLIESGRKCIQIIRDPRAVIASNRVNEYGSYPLLFLIRQWRKSVAYHLSNKGSSDYMMIKYEVLSGRNKEIPFRAISDFLSIAFDEEVMNPENYLDGRNEPWKRNTSYQSPIQKLESNSGPKWKSVLLPEEVKIIEKLCFPEMKLLSYEFTDDQDQDQFLDKKLTKYEVKENRAKWIEKYDFEFTGKQYDFELKRFYLLKSEEIVAEEVIEKYFITKQAYECYRQL
jgi:hypothetical protein